MAQSANTGKRDLGTCAATHRQAFVRLNGLLPTIADLAFPQLEHCGENISSVENTTLTGRILDRRLLVSYPKQTWDSLAHGFRIRYPIPLL
jgi:hypothetical protein